MSISKNPGSPLTSDHNGEETSVPRHWRAKLGLTKVVQENPINVGVDPNAGLRIESRADQERTNERKKANTSFRRDPRGTTIIEYVRTKDGQVGKRIRRYVREGERPPAFNELMQEFSQQADGNGWSEQISTTVANLFGSYDYIVERPDRTPPDFGALLKTFEVSHTVKGIAVMPTLGVGEFRREERQLDEQTKRVSVRYRDLASLPATIVNSETDREKQVVTITRILELDTTIPAVPTDKIDVSFEKLGDGTAIETRRTIPTLYARQVFAKEIADRVPPDFGALIPVTEEAHIEDGSPSMPSLGTGELMRREEEETVLTKRVTVRKRDVTGLPKQLVDYETDRDKLVVTVTRTWDLEVNFSLPPTPTATEDYEYKVLGDGTAILTQRTKDVFPGPVYGISVENLIPAMFRAFIPTFSSDITSTGTANPTPTLTTGELRHEEQQVDAFNKRTKSVSLGSITPGTSFTNQETTEDYGGGVLDVILTIDTTGTMTIDTGPFVVSSQLVNLGNGYEIKTTRVLQGMSPSWPVLTEYDQDPETQSLITTTYQVVDASSVSAPSIVNGVLTRFKKIDVWRSLMIVETYSLPAAYDEQRFMAHQFPSLWDWHTYNYSTACGPTGPIRQGFSTMVQARLHISYTTTKSTITGLTLIPNTIRLVHDVINAVLNDVGVLVYAGTCSGPITFPASSPDFSTYTSTIQGSEQLISGESVLWRAGLYKNSELYVTML